MRYIEKAIELAKMAEQRKSNIGGGISPEYYLLMGIYYLLITILMQIGGYRGVVAEQIKTKIEETLRW